VLYAILLVNLVGIAYGFYYYAPQFADTPVWLWPLVPDSPMAILLMTVALGFVAVDRSKPWLNLLGSAAMLQVGVWTAIVLAWFPQHFGFSYLPNLGCTEGAVFGCGNLNTYLFYLHLGMALEPLVVADQLPLEIAPFAAVGGGLLAHDVIDYTWPVDYLGRGCEGIFPHTLPCTNVSGVFAATVSLTLASMGTLAWLSNATIAGRS
jgi:uncharacterized membrane protein YpjA